MGTDLALASPRDRHITEHLPPQHPHSWETAGPPSGPGSSVLTEVGKLQLPPLVDEQVLGFQVPVQDLAAVAVGKAPEQLEHENLGQEGAEESGNVSPPGRPSLRLCPMAGTRMGTGTGQG